jgi:hypothetical protein
MSAPRSFVIGPMSGDHMDHLQLVGLRGDQAAVSQRVRRQDSRFATDREHNELGDPVLATAPSWLSPT